MCSSYLIENIAKEFLKVANQNDTYKIKILEDISKNFVIKPERNQVFHIVKGLLK